MKLLVSDFDCTLLNNDDYEKNILAINNFVSKGNYFVIATGRYIDSLYRKIKNTGLIYNYLICDDGGIIFDNELKVVFKKDIPDNVVLDILDRHGNSDGVSEWYVNTGLEITKDYTKPANGFLGYINDRDKSLTITKSILDDFKDVNAYLSNQWINIVSKDVNKGTGIRYIQKLLNVKDNDVYTIGDNTNDLSMSLYPFNNYRMTNSVPELKEVTVKAYDAVYQLIDDILKDEE